MLVTQVWGFESERVCLRGSLGWEGAGLRAQGLSFWVFVDLVEARVPLGVHKELCVDERQ